MSSRGDHRRRDRSWERDERDRDRVRDKGRYGNNRSGRAPNRDEKRRSSRSRSPRQGDRDKERDRDRKDRRDRDYDYKRDDGRRSGDKRDDRKKHWDKREPSRREDRDEKYPRDVDMKDRGSQSGPPSTQPDKQKGSATSSVRPSVDPITPDCAHEDGEAMDDVKDDEGAMMAAMGLSGFGSTKGKPVAGNQEGATDIKKTRTWRQYMNRRGGFNRPLDKIK